MGIDFDQVYGGVYRPRVLIIDDDDDTVFLLKEIFKANGFDVVGANRGVEAVRKCTEFKPDCILLDLMMPEMDGWQTLQYLQQASEAPIILLTALMQKDDVVRGLQMGAEDYITKPFHNQEVIARVKNVIRRAGNHKSIEKLVFPTKLLTYDFNTQEVIIRNKKAVLTGRENAVFAILASAGGETVRYEKIAHEVWGEDKPEVRKRIKYLIYLLRRKLEIDPEQPEIIVNVEGVGYRLNI